MLNHLLEENNEQDSCLYVWRCAPPKALLQMAIEICDRLVFSTFTLASLCVFLYLQLATTVEQ